MQKGFVSFNLLIHLLLVIAIEINQKRLDCAKKNAEIYGVSDKIEFILGDCLEILPTLHADAVFLSPPWGGELLSSLVTVKCSQVSHIIAPSLISKICQFQGMPIYFLKLFDLFRKLIFETARKVTENVVYYLPKSLDHSQMHA